MIQIALIPVLGVLLLLAMTVYVQSRRASKVAAFKRRIEKQSCNIVRNDVANDQLLVDSIICGVGIDQAFQHFQTTRAALLPGGDSDAPANWSSEDLDSWKSTTIRRGIESINRKLLVPAIFGFVFIVAVSVVTTTVLYSFQSPENAATAPADSTGVSPLPFSPAPLTPIEQPPGIPPFDDSADDLLSDETDARTAAPLPADDEPTSSEDLTVPSDTSDEGPTL